MPSRPNQTGYLPVANLIAPHMGRKCGLYRLQQALLQQA